MEFDPGPNDILDGEYAEKALVEGVHPLAFPPPGEEGGAGGRGGGPQGGRGGHGGHPFL